MQSHFPDSSIEGGSYIFIGLIITYITWSEKSREIAVLYRISQFGVIPQFVSGFLKTISGRNLFYPPSHPYSLTFTPLHICGNLLKGVQEESNIICKWSSSILLSNYNDLNNVIVNLNKV